MKVYGFLKESHRNLDLEANGSDLMVFSKESDRNLDLETNGSDFIVLVRNLIGI